MLLGELSEADAREIAVWRNAPPYDCYDYPAWEQMAREGWAICDEALRREQFRAARADHRSGAELVGYVWFQPAIAAGTDSGTPDSLVLHLGLRPDHCGQHLSRVFLPLVLAEARRRAGGVPVTLRVRRGNARAIAAYRRAGFEMTEGTGELVTMTADPPAARPAAPPARRRHASATRSR